MTAIVGVGIDLIDLDHFTIHYGRLDPDLLARCFTPGEIAHAGDGVDRLSRLAGRFAVKEAAFKALGGGEAISHLNIETLSGASGAPQLCLNGPAQDAAAAQFITAFFVSITHSPASAAAVVIACGSPR
jgi:holo-[acyl-carrier protein] synthase